MREDRNQEASEADRNRFHAQRNNHQPIFCRNSRNIRRYTLWRILHTRRNQRDSGVCQRTLYYHHPRSCTPGTLLAALATYPELGCTGGPYEVGTRWGIYDDVLCAGNENIYPFIEDVLLEVFKLFPGEYVHIGGDECAKTRWKSCPKCQSKIKELKLKDEHELQSYVIRRVEKFLNKNGKKLIGWDEILEGGIAPNAALMSWRGVAGGITAAKSGHPGHHDS